MAEGSWPPVTLRVRLDLPGVYTYEVLIPVRTEAIARALFRTLRRIVDRQEDRERRAGAAANR